jgi:hypothetical protein
MASTRTRARTQRRRHCRRTLCTVLVCLRAADGSGHRAQRIDESVIGPTKMLALMNQANDAASPRRIQCSEFYNDAINQVASPMPAM